MNLLPGSCVSMSLVWTGLVLDGLVTVTAGNWEETFQDFAEVKLFRIL